MVLAKSLKVGKLVNIFARKDGRRAGFRDLLQKIREVPGTAAPAPGNRLLSPTDHDPGLSPCVSRQERYIDRRRSRAGERDGSARGGVEGWLGGAFLG